MLKCMKIAEIIEQTIYTVIETLITMVQTICREVVTTIEEWQSRWENQCRTVSEKVCKWMPWPLSELCDWVTKTVCNLVEVWFRVIKTIVKTVCEVITSLIKIFILIPMTIFLTILRIVCFIVDFVVNWIRIIISIFVGLPEFLLCMLGLNIRKHLHACVTVLAGRDGVPVVSDAQVDTALKEASDIISRRFNVHLHIHGRKLVQVPPDRLDVTACDASQLFSSEAINLTDDADGTFADVFGCSTDPIDVVTELLHGALNINMRSEGDTIWHAYVFGRRNSNVLDLPNKSNVSSHRTAAFIGFTQ